MKNKKVSLRTIVQLSIFILVFSITISKYLSELGITIPFIKGVSLHAICPFGGVETLYTLFVNNTFIQKIHPSSIVLMVAVLIVSIFFGAAFCGWICPFGFYQEMLSKFGKKIFRKRKVITIPKAIDNILKYLKYVVLILVLYNTASTAKLVFQEIDPYYALFNFFTNEVAITAYAMLLLFSVLSLFVERPFCRYFCPYGAILGLFNYISIFKIQRNKSTCINCKLCDKNCPVDIIVSNQDTITDPACIRCMKCTSQASCPKANTVEFSNRKFVKMEEKANEINK